jgi:WD40 repeat protein
MPKVFISYSRKDMEFARKLTGELQKSDMDFWVDWEGIPPTVDWWKEIEKGIEEADSFIFLISPDSAASKICGQEIDCAVKNSKRIIPLVVRDVKGDAIPRQLSHLNWIFFRESDDFNTAIQRLLNAINTDYDWVKSHRRLQMKALEWERSDKESSFLLRGKDLQDAEFQLATNTSKEPHPTDLQREYVFKSNQAADRQRKIVLGISIAGVIALALLAMFGFYQAGEATLQRNVAQTAQVQANDNAATSQANANSAAIAQAKAEKQARISRAGELSAQSVTFRDKNFQLAFLLSIEAYRKEETLQTRGTLLDNVQAHPQLYQFIMGYTNAIRSVAFSPDGKTLISSSEDGSIILWDIATRKPIGQPLTGSDVAFSPDGKILASNTCGKSDDKGNCIQGDIIFWDVAARKPIGQPLTQSGRVASMAFSPDGKTLASGGADGSITLWDVSTMLNTSVAAHHLIGQSLIGHTNIVYSVAFSPDGKILASGSGDKTIILWDVATQQPIGQPLTGNTGNTSSSNGLVFSPDGKTLASGSASYAIILWDVATRNPIGELPMGGTDWVNCLAFSPDGKTLASGSSNNSIIMWDVATRQRVGQLTGHSGIISSVAFSPDGKTFAAGSKDRSISLWDVSSVLDTNIARRQPIGQTLSGHAINSTVFSPDGKILASASGDKSVILWDVSTRQIIEQSLTGHGIMSVDFSLDGKTLVFGGCSTTDEKGNCTQGEVILWDVAAHQLIGQPLTEHTDTVRTVAFSPDGKIIASAGEDSSIILWDVATRQSIWTLKGLTGTVYSVTFSPDGKILASGSDDKSISLWDVSTMLNTSVATHQSIGQPLTGHTSKILSLTFSPDGKVLASGSADKTIILWDIATRQPIGQPLTGHIEAIKSLSFSPDGKTLVSGSKDSSLILWDVATHQTIGQPLTGHTNVVDAVAFSPDGKTIASGSKDGSLILWDMDLQSWIEQSCQRGGRNFTRAEWSLYIGDTTPYQATCPNLPIEPEPTPTP